MSDAEKITLLRERVSKLLVAGYDLATVVEHEIGFCGECSDKPPKEPLCDACKRLDYMLAQWVRVVSCARGDLRATK